jgi:chemotaxis protein CheD
MNQHPHKRPREAMPPVLRGFEQIHRYWDTTADKWSAKLLPGEFFVSMHDECITTVLGSCISACIRDTALGYGGMNHFMLPEDHSVGPNSWTTGAGGLATRYGSYAMESLINELMKLGARRERLEVKIFGGGKILPAMTDVGAKNIAFARQFVTTEGFRLAAEDVGEVFPRRVLYFPKTGRVMIKRLRALDADAIAQRESQYQRNLAAKPKQDDVELF